MKKVLIAILKFGSAFIIVFVIYTLIYHYKVDSSVKKPSENTFLASTDQIIELEGESASGIGVSNTGLNESNIDKKGFYLRIDRIDLFKPIVKNVDPRYKDVYTQSWETGVSHGKFTSLPNQIGNVYLFAHAVTDEARILEENAWFTRLDELKENDAIIVYYEGNKYVYQVSKIYSVDPSATGVYTGVSPVPKVTLQTCGPPMGSLKSRYMIEGLQVSTTSL